MYFVVVFSLVMTWELVPQLKPLRFGTQRDVGITIYLLLVGFWFYMRFPALVLAPVFFADPGGAVVGKNVDKHYPQWNAKWYGNKTICGSAAVLLLTYASLGYTASPAARLVIAVAAMVGEAVGGSYDNLLVAAVVVIGWHLLT